MEPHAEKLNRPGVPALDEILGAPFKVLDDGLIRVVDYMGDDAAVVQAARVSYGQGTKAVSDDRGLIRYLLQHRHTTPFEMCSLKLHVRVPMDAWRQWIRHRTACLAEGTEVYFDLPGGINRRGNQLHKLKIEDIWQKFQPTANTQRPDKQRDPYFRRDRIRNMKLRHLNETTGCIEPTRIVDVFKNGSKPVFKFTLADGKTIEATADHRFLFASGWNSFRNEVGLRERNGLASWDKKEVYLQVNGAALELPALYQDADWLDEKYNLNQLKIQDIADLCEVSYHTIRKWIRLHGLQHERGGRSREPWNKGKTYVLGSRGLTPEHRETIQRTRSGGASNFWRGGVSSDRESIGRWTTQAAHRVHQRHGWTCQLCLQRATELHCHHIVPVWADPTLGREESNLTTLCGDCHRRVHRDELAYVKKLGGPPVKTAWHKRPRVAWNRLVHPRLVRVDRIEYVGVKETYDLEVAGPHHNFIANGIVTHNSVNEYSTRYSVAIDASQRTAPDQWRTQATDNKQGSGAALDLSTGAQLTAAEQELHRLARHVYQTRIDAGVAREQARKDLPLCTYTEAYWKIDLHNLLHFLALRMDSHAQKEIRDYATVIGEQIVARWVPLTWEAFQDFRFQGLNFSRIETEIVAAIGAGNLDAARELAGAAGWLKPAKSGGLVRSRERLELEEKLRRLHLDVPWAG